MRAGSALAAALLLITAVLLPGPASADDPQQDAAATVENPSGATAASGYTKKGADTCLKCHDDESDTLTFNLAGLFKTAHARRTDERSPFGSGGLQCEACHGPGAKHAAKGEALETINSLKANSKLPVAQRNEPCLACHQDQPRMAWHVGAHDRDQVACADCHQLHVQRDPVLAKPTESEVCFRCHREQRGEFQQASSHPVRFGSMTCSDCHNAHGSVSEAMLIKPTVNQTCYTCHAEKRGPLLWEHAPVAEDCSLCHSSHGSARTAMLNKSPPLLCQQCHSQAGHPSVAYTAAGLPGGGGGGSIFLLAGGCTNCHTQVHGSNHPAGAKLLR